MLPLHEKCGNSLIYAIILVKAHFVYYPRYIKKDILFALFTKLIYFTIVLYILPVEKLPKEFDLDAI